MNLFLSTVVLVGFFAFVSMLYREVFRVESALPAEGEEYTYDPDEYHRSRAAYMENKAATDQEGILERYHMLVGMHNHAHPDYKAELEKEIDELERIMEGR